MSRRHYVRPVIGQPVITDREAMTDRHRGHYIELYSGRWVYSDTLDPVRDDPNRACGHCGKGNTPEGHDGCLGTLPGVYNACCGHGETGDAYVIFDHGDELREERALGHFAEHNAGPTRPTGKRVRSSAWDEAAEN